MTISMFCNINGDFFKFYDYMIHDWHYIIVLNCEDIFWSHRSSAQPNSEFWWHQNNWLNSVTLQTPSDHLNYVCRIIINEAEDLFPTCKSRYKGNVLLTLGGQRPPAKVNVSCYYYNKLGAITKSPPSNPVSVTVQGKPNYRIFICLLIHSLISIFSILL